MASIAESWNHMADGNALIRFVDVNLRGAGQVMFQNNPVTGLLFIVGIAWGAYVANMPAVAIGAVVGLLVATLTAYALHVDVATLRIGLFGYNGILVGAALPTFLVVDPLLWLYIVLGAAVSTVAFLAVANVFKTWGVAALTFPFVLVTWFLVLAAYAFNGVPIASMGPPAIPQAIAATAAAIPTDTQFWLDSFFNGVAQVFLIGNGVTGVIFLIALAVSSLWAALFAMLGAGVAVLIAVLFGADASTIQAGLFGFSPVLTAIALGCTFYKPSWPVFFYALLGIIFTVFVQAAMDVALTPIGIPTFTAPFIFATWLFLLPKENLAPVRHERAAQAVVGEKVAATKSTADKSASAEAVMAKGKKIK
ncbi:MAG TPA: urea transporter [Caldilinea sp.]|nr:urea transporter [Caldilinea sp.]